MLWLLRSDWSDDLEGLAIKVLGLLDVDGEMEHEERDEQKLRGLFNADDSLF